MDEMHQNRSDYPHADNTINSTFENPQTSASTHPQTDWNPQAQQESTQTHWNTQPQDTGWNMDTSMQQTPYQTPVREGTLQEPVYHSYEEWQQQNQQQKQQQKTHKSHRKAFCAVGGIAAACLIFAGGAFAGGAFAGQSSANTPVASADTVKGSTPTLNISKTESAQDGTLSGEAIYEKVSPSVVSIVSTSLTSSGSSSGSGVIMTSDGYIITNAHVIEGADKVDVITSDGMQYTAEIIGSDTKTDLAVLKVNSNGVTFTAAEFGDSSELKAGEKAYAIGSPGGVELANSITTGSISAINRDITVNDRVMTLIQTDASINPGNSGGALINQHGQVIGITSAKLGISYYEGLGFAIPIDTAKDIVDQLIAYGYVPGRPAIGVTGYNLGEQTAAYNNVPQGVLITEVDSRSDAAAQGLQAKDIITAVNGKTITTMDEINVAKEKMSAGDKMTLTVYRISTGKTMDITITLADENDLSSSSTANNSQNNNSQSSGNYYSNGGNAFTFPWSY